MQGMQVTQVQHRTVGMGEFRNTPRAWVSGSPITPSPPPVGGAQRRFVGLIAAGPIALRNVFRRGLGHHWIAGAGLH